MPVTILQWAQSRIAWDRDNTNSKIFSVWCFLCSESKLNDKLGNPKTEVCLLHKITDSLDVRLMCIYRVSPKSNNDSDKSEELREVVIINTVVSIKKQRYRIFFNSITYVQTRKSYFALMKSLNMIFRFFFLDFGYESKVCL